MKLRKDRFRSWVQVEVPTKDKNDKRLSEASVNFWLKRAESLFRKQHVGFQVLRYYRLEGHYPTLKGGWIKEPNYVIRAYASTEACRRLVAALENDFVRSMGQALNQEAVSIKSSMYGHANYYSHAANR